MVMSEIIFILWKYIEVLGVEGHDVYNFLSNILNKNNICKTTANNKNKWGKMLAISESGEILKLFCLLFL